MEGRIKVVNIESKKDSIVELDTFISKGMVNFTITGMVSRTIRESKTRIKQAFKTNGLKLPYGNIITNISPANVKKDGTHFDLAIALSIMKAQGLISISDDYAILGELNIDGSLIPLNNPSRFINACIENNLKNIIIAKGNYEYISLFDDLNIIMVENLKEAINYFRGKFKQKSINYEIPEVKLNSDINDLIYQDSLIRALTIAISGNHSILIRGPIGSGKTYTINSLKSILPNLSKEEALILDDIRNRFNLNTKFNLLPEIYNVELNTTVNSLFGTKNKLGNISISNFGIALFDEFNLFSKKILENLKLYLDYYHNYDDNLEKFYDYPVNNTIIALMNPCPCGKLGTNEKCTCTQGEISRFNSKIEESLLDRFQIKITINLPKYYHKEKSNYDIKNIKRSIKNAYEIQSNRYSNTYIRNSIINSNQVNKYITLDNNIIEILNKFKNKFNFSKRTYDNIIKVAQTIADYENCYKILEEHIYEAINYQLLR